MHEIQLYPKRLTVWCGFHSGGVIGPFFFFDENGAPTTVNGDRYRATIPEYFWTQFDTMNVDDMWFQQDGATCHTAYDTIELLQTKFGGRVILRNGPRE